MAKRLPEERLLTLEEYARLPDDDSWRDELSRGKLVREPRPRFIHSRLQAQIAAELWHWAAQHDAGVVTTEGGFILERDPDTVRGPDVAFVANARLQGGTPELWPDFAPDLVVEIRSPSDHPRRMKEKIAQYFGAGTRLLWLIDPAKRTAAVYRHADAYTLLGEADALEGDDVLPGFRCEIKTLFQ